MTDRLSVIIPTLNEARYLPALLHALKHQTRAPDEIIIADADSRDATVEIARMAGARVVEGGKPPAGRNAGVRAATGDLFLFLDADVVPTRDFIARALAEFHEQRLAVATCLLAPLDERLSDRVVSEMANVYMQMVQFVAPHAGGFCILVRREIHAAIGGFDESLLMAEDHDYVQRAAQHGEFGVLTSVRIPVSSRRLEKEGVVRLGVKYFYCEMHALARWPIRSLPFVYEFGNYEALPTARRFVDVARLRRQLGRFENPLTVLSERGRTALASLGSFRLGAEGFEERLQMLRQKEWLALHRYLRLRLAPLHRGSRPFLRRAWARMQVANLRESIRLLELDWQRLMREEDLDPLAPPEPDQHPSRHDNQ
jgi:glycosyltransferase involved in cell wall biosynthesis